MGDVRVLGEWVDDLAEQLVGLTWRFTGDECRIDGKVPPQSPVMRAWFRAEAELLLDDATDMSHGRYVHRTPGRAAVRGAGPGARARGGSVDTAEDGERAGVHDLT
jgi:hypothetical protein